MFLNCKGHEMCGAVQSLQTCISSMTPQLETNFSTC